MIADLEDRLVQPVEGLGDAPLGYLARQLGGGFQTQPDLEQLVGDPIEQLPDAVGLLGDRSPGQVGQVGAPLRFGQVPDHGQHVVTGGGGHRAQADLDREGGSVLPQPGQAGTAAHRPRPGSLAVDSPLLAVGRSQVERNEQVNRPAEQLLAPVAEHLRAAPVDQHDLAVVIDQGQAVAQGVDQLPEHGGREGRRAGHGGEARRAPAVGPRPVRLGCGNDAFWHPGRDRRLQRGIHRYQAVQPFDADDAPDHGSGHHQPQLRAADRRPLIGPRERVDRGVVAGHGAGHVDDQHGGAAVDHRQQLLAEQAHVGHADVVRQRHDRPPAPPLHRGRVIQHGRHPGEPRSRPGPGARARRPAGQRSRASPYPIASPRRAPQILRYAFPAAPRVLRLSRPAAPRGTGPPGR
jgi:hypothetical protein